MCFEWHCFCLKIVLFNTIEVHNNEITITVVRFILEKMMRVFVYTYSYIFYENDTLAGGMLKWSFEFFLIFIAYRGFLHLYTTNL